MAITTTTISKAAGWARTDIIYQLEEAFTWLGWHGSTRTGIVTGISAYSGGGTVGTSGTDYYDVFPATTTGIGTGASFRVDRSSGSIIGVYVNRPGYGYTDGEYVTLSAADIGGAANGAVAIGITVKVAGNAIPTGYGSTITFYDSDISGTYPWGVLRHQIQPNKKFGSTFRGFKALSNTQLRFSAGSDFHPWNTTNNLSLGNGLRNRWCGNLQFDVGYVNASSAIELSNETSGEPNYLGDLTISNSNLYQLDLNVYRSSIDPKFVVFAYKQPTLSSTAITNNTFGAFFIHNFETPLWDLDYLYLGGMTTIEPESSPTTVPRILFRTKLAPIDNYLHKRCAEYGYSSNGNIIEKVTYYESSIYPQTSTVDVTFYNRSADTSTGGQSGLEMLSPNTYYNAVIKGIPLSVNIAPCPYYLPDDFVLIDFKYNVPSANIQQGDTITISGSEVYTVITGSYNQTTTTRGILFCARTV